MESSIVKPLEFGERICFSFHDEVIKNLKLYLSKEEARIAYIFHGEGIQDEEFQEEKLFSHEKTGSS